MPRRQDGGNALRPIVIGLPCGYFACSCCWAQWASAPACLDRAKPGEGAQRRHLFGFCKESAVRPRIPQPAFREGEPVLLRMKASTAGARSPATHGSQVLESWCLWCNPDSQPASPPTSHLQAGHRVRGLPLPIGKPGANLRFFPQVAQKKVPPPRKKIKATRDRNGDRLGTQIELQRVVGRLADGSGLSAESEFCAWAVFHSARDTFAMLIRQGCAIEQSVSIGLRIEHPQPMSTSAAGGPSPAIHVWRCRVTSCRITAEWTNRLQLLLHSQGAWGGRRLRTGPFVTQRMIHSRNDAMQQRQSLWCWSSGPGSIPASGLGDPRRGGVQRPLGSQSLRSRRKDIGPPTKEFCDFLAKQP